MYKRKIKRPETFEKLWIVERRTRVGRNGETIFVLSDGTERTTRQLTEMRGLNCKTMFYRIRKHGLNSPLILHPGPLSQEVLESYGVEYRFSKQLMHSTSVNDWDRKRCRRDGINCKKYSECQAARVGMNGAGQWVAPGSTDQCYEAETSFVWGYSSGLSHGAISMNLLAR